MPSDRAVALAAQWATEAALITGGETVAAGHRHSQSDIDDLLLALQSRLSTAQLGQPLGAAPLDANAKVPVFYLPDISTTRGVFPVASQAAMLALNAQVGAVAVRSDLNGQSYILAALPASNLSNWLSQSPPGTVTSVNGQTGAVTIPVPAVATTTTDGLMPAGDRLLLSGQGATDTQVLRRVGGVIVWANPVIWTVRTSNATLGANEDCAANSGVTELTLPTTASGGHEILNNTTAAITIWRGGTATISGIARSTGAAIAATDRVRILPGQRGTFVASGGNWIAQGCEPPFLVFAYNETPLANNPNNPLSASDLFHWLWIQNNNTNPANTTWLTVVASSEWGGWGTASVLSNRVANSADIAQHLLTTTGSNGWCAWQLRSGYTFRPTGVLYLWNNTNGPFATSFEVKAANGTTLTTATDVSAWATLRSVTGLTGSNGAWQFYSLTSSSFYSQFGIRNSASSGELRISYQEFCWFGELFLP